MTANSSLVCSAVLTALTVACAAPVPTGEVSVVSSSAIDFPAVVGAASFGDSDMAGYHLVVWDGGGAADHALFQARVSDLQVIEALQKIGASPGNALGIDSWDERHDPDTSAPDKTIEGPQVVVEVITPDGRTIAMDEILEDSGARGFDMRFGGHEANIDAWHSGCVVCLYSCPGSKVGNAAYTVRDFVAGATHFRVRPGVLPEDGSEVRIRIRLLDGTP